MRTSLFVLAFFSLLGTVGVPAQTAREDLMEVAEASSAHATLPDRPDGYVSFKSCSTCPSLEARANATTEYFVGEQRVSLAQLRSAVVGKDVLLLVGYTPRSRVLKRVTAYPQVSSR